ncbi:unnamed protein product [Arabidopsis thaliana]|uniref:Uncharacterized protein n=1 Tax=Arabidopsis thaliana TaxID=3702 RepID=A0A5S9XRY0_ARATH|nr:unnamed protein product [Arabidopsis thaliana]
MNCFLLPSTICSEINSVISTFWWGKDNGKTKLPWVAWNRLSLPKREGGLGFKDLQKFNKALLAKQAWRILKNPSSLLARLYKTLYYPTSSYLQALNGSAASYGWRSIQEGKTILQQGLRVRIGNGENTKIWEDPWLPCLPPRPAHGPILDEEMTVSDLWKPNIREWDPIVFDGVLNPEDQQLAKTLYLSKHAEEDTYVWAYTKDAQYTVHSGYWVTTHVDVQDNEIIQPPHGSVELKQKIWKLKVAPKIQHFLWRCLSDALSTATLLRTRNIPADPTCQRCCQEEETVNHILFTCTYAQMVWRCVNINFGSLLVSDNLEDNLNRLMELQKVQNIPLSNRLLPFWIMWRIWKSRNAFLFQKKDYDPACEARKGTYDVQEWIDTNATSPEANHDPPLSSGHSNEHTRSRQWIPPLAGWVKCNFDSGYVRGRSFTNTGWIVRDNRGKVIRFGGAKLQEAHSALQAEAMGLLHALQMIWTHGLRFVTFEGDNWELIKLVNTMGDHNEIGTLLVDIRFWMKKLPYMSLRHVNRERNAAADAIAIKASFLNSLSQTFTIPPQWLVNYLYYPYTI